MRSPGPPNASIIAGGSPSAETDRIILTPADRIADGSSIAAGPVTPRTAEPGARRGGRSGEEELANGGPSGTTLFLGLGPGRTRSEGFGVTGLIASGTVGLSVLTGFGPFTSGPFGSGGGVMGLEPGPAPTRGGLGLSGPGTRGERPRQVPTLTRERPAGLRGTSEPVEPTSGPEEQRSPIPWSSRGEGLTSVSAGVVTGRGGLAKVGTPTFSRSCSHWP